MIPKILSKNKKTDDRSFRTVLNIIFSFFLKGISIIITFIQVPITLKYLDSTKFGIWLTLSSMVAWFSFFDIGLGNGFRNKYAQSKAKNEIKDAKMYLSTTYISISVIFFLYGFYFSC